MEKALSFLIRLFFGGLVASLVGLVTGGMIVINLLEYTSREDKFIRTYFLEAMREIEVWIKTGIITDRQVKEAETRYNYYRKKVLRKE